MKSSMLNITGKIKGIKYRKEIVRDLPKIDLKDLDINLSPPSFIVGNFQNSFAMSKWVSPKRTRSYPYERIYDTIHISKNITVIPIVKDEGLNGDRDYLQWDTISLMSLLNVFVIFAFYVDADKSDNFANKITNQKFDNDYLLCKIKEIRDYHSSALHWNLKELQNNLSSLIDLVKKSYLFIERKTKVKLHNFKGIDDYKNKIDKDAYNFMEFSRDKSQRAQNRELVVYQPRENSGLGSKARITISNYLGGLYYFTVDRASVHGNTVELTECKHSAKSILPSEADIKDGLLKMILFSNIVNIKVDGKAVKGKAVLRLTSADFKGNICSSDSKEKICKCLTNNALRVKNIDFIDAMFKEARKNNFMVEIRGEND